MQNFQKLKVAAQEIKTAFDAAMYAKDRVAYNQFGLKYGKLAYDTFMEFLPPLETTYVRFRQQFTGLNPLDKEFWQDEEAVRVLYEALEEEGYYACS